MLHILPDIRTLRRLCWDGGAIISLAEAFTLKDVLCVLTLQITGDHRGIGHARRKHSFDNVDLKQFIYRLNTALNHLMLDIYPKYAGVRRVNCWAVFVRVPTLSVPSESVLSQSYGSFSTTL